MRSSTYHGAPAVQAGAPVDGARGALLLVHGRGGSPEDMLTLGRELEADDFAWFAPRATGHSWYPYSFLAPMERNEPGLSSGLAVLGELLDGVVAAGLPAKRIVLLGFSQGACLSLEFVARNAPPLGGVAGLSGGLIGPPGTARHYGGSLTGTRVFLGCSDVDPHIPLERVHETSAVFREMGADITQRIYPGMGHTVNVDELQHVREMISQLREIEDLDAGQGT